MIKRLFDFSVAALGLLVLSPLLLAIALWIKLDSRGPVFFRQERVGRFGKPFLIYKFRTMVQAPPDNDRQITVGTDPRITRAGRWLRHAKLDELPQLIDVVTGRMSLVGPRPEVPRYVLKYPPEVRSKVLSVRPGTTDYASIHYRRESALLASAADPEREYVEVVMPEKLRYAVQYVDEASLATDLRLIALTLKALVRG